MPSPHGPRRARITFSDSAVKQLENITSEADIQQADPLDVVGVLAQPGAGGAAGERLTDLGGDGDDDQGAVQGVLGFGFADRGRRRVPRGLTTEGAEVPHLIQQLSAHRVLGGLRTGLAGCSLKTATLREGPAQDDGPGAAWLVFLCPAHSDDLPA